MFIFPHLKKIFKRCIRRVCSLFVGLAFLASSALPAGLSYAQVISSTILNLPVPGSMVTTTAGFIPPLIKGLTIYPNNPLEFNFIVDTGQSGIKIDAPEFRTESRKLIKYFLAALTIPDENMWVNLSPYEKDRIISAGFGQTEMGRDLLAQDYLLKQLMASLTYPDDELGKKFWDKVYAKARQLYGTTNIPVNTFNKIWIVPDKAVVYEIGATAYVVKTHLKVMLEGDYLALKENMDNKKLGMDKLNADDKKQLSDVSSAIVKEVLLPAIEQEVNEGKTFANLRQIYQSMVLATWYKKNLKESLLGQVYVNQNKIKGVDLDDKTAKEKIYQQYLAAFKKGVYNYIKEDTDPVTQKNIPRKYFSGGFQPNPNIVATEAKVETADQFAPEPRETFKQNITQPLSKSVAQDAAALVEVSLVESPEDSTKVNALEIAIREREQQKEQKNVGIPANIRKILNAANVNINNIFVQSGEENVQQVLDRILAQITTNRQKVHDWLFGGGLLIMLNDEELLGDDLAAVQVKAGDELFVMARHGGGAGDNWEQWARNGQARNFQNLDLAQLQQAIAQLQPILVREPRNRNLQKVLVAIKIRALRLEQGMNEARFAAAIGPYRTSRHIVNLLENGTETLPEKAANLKKIDDRFHTDLMTLAYGPRGSLRREIVELRLREGMTQPDFATAIGIDSLGTISKWETGSSPRAPEAENLKKIDNRFGTDLMTLAYGAKGSLRRDIVELRIEQGMTQAVFATAIGTSQGSVNNWENGKGSPRAQSLKKIDDRFRTNFVTYPRQTTVQDEQSPEGEQTGPAPTDYAALGDEAKPTPQVSSTARVLERWVRDGRVADFFKIWEEKIQYTPAPEGGVVRRDVISMLERLEQEGVSHATEILRRIQEESDRLRTRREVLQRVKMDYRRVMTMEEIDHQIDEIPKETRPGIGFENPTGEGTVNILLKNMTPVGRSAWKEFRIPVTNLTAFTADGEDLYIAEKRDNEIVFSKVSVKGMSAINVLELRQSLFMAKLQANELPEQVRKDFGIEESPSDYAALTQEEPAIATVPVGGIDLNPNSSTSKSSATETACRFRFRSSRLVQ